METTIIILHASSYSIQDEKTGEIKEGATIFYYPSGSMKPYQAKGKDAKGRKPCKSSLPIEELVNITVCPGVYRAEVEMVSNSNLKSENTVVSVEFISEV